MAAITYSDLKDLIPRYDGNKNKLDEFIQTVDSLETQLTEDRDKKLFDLSVKSHLTGTAFNAIRHLKVTTWPEIKKSLKDKLNPLDATTCYTALTHVKQNQNENMTDFAIRVETLLTNLNRSSTIGAENATIKYVHASNERLAKRAFENGILNFKLKTLIIAKNQDTLERAIIEALDLDSTGEFKNYEKRNNTSNNKKFCGFCKRSNHTESECFKKNKK